MPNHRQLFRRSIGEVLSDMLQRRFPVRTAKQAAGVYGVSLPTAENAKKGHASIVLLERAIEVEGWDFLAAFGRELTGISYEEYLEEKYKKLIVEAEREKQTISRLHLRREALARQSAEQYGADAGEAASEPRRRNG